MRRILFQETDFTTFPTPPVGFKYIGFDGPNFSEKDDGNIISPVSGSGVMTEVTHSQILGLINASELNEGSYYKITDFKTCYDQPDYDIYGNAIVEGNYKQGDNYPIIVFATSNNTLDSYAFQPDFPKDIIRYDVSWTQSEITSGTAYGRITERIDNLNNRTDYDHREILFKRYNWYAYDANDPQQGTISVANGLVTGVDTQFTNLSVGWDIAIPFFSELYFTILSIDSNTQMSLTGSVWNVTATNIKYYLLDYPMYYKSAKKNNVNDDFFEYTTFGDAIDNETAINNYIGDHANSHIEWGTGDFLLANNVFLSGEYINNKFGNNCYNNTFDDDCTDNTIGNFFTNNITDDDFDGNQIGNYFQGNVITANFQRNVVGENFNSNIITVGSFYRNKIGEQFENNKISGADFQNNILGNAFNANSIKTINQGFIKNIIGVGFNGNRIKSYFDSNTFGNGANNNEFHTPFYENKIGDYFEDNMVYSDFYENHIKNDFYQNTIGDLSNIGGYTYYRNSIGVECKGNLFGGNAYKNQIANYFVTNQIGTEFSNNVIGNGFFVNTIGEQFQYNLIGNEFTFNNIADYFVKNTIGNNFDDNSITNNFAFNHILDNFYNNTIGDDFGFGGGQARGNRIGNYFQDNIVGEYFYNNVVADVFDSNTIGDSFQNNDIRIQNLNTEDFTTYLGNILTFSSNTPAGTNNTYSNISATGGSGVDASFTVVVSGGVVTTLTLVDAGRKYLVNDVLTITGTNIGGVDGVDDISITVLTISATPSVYETYNCSLFRNSSSEDRLSYYDGDDVLTIKDINL